MDTIDALDFDNNLSRCVLILAPHHPSHADFSECNALHLVHAMHYIEQLHAP